jgi:poly(3-hydroxybutyrate) depolymerase
VRIKVSGIALAALTAGLAACSSPNIGNVGSTVVNQPAQIADTPTEAAALALGPGSASSTTCNTPYGNAPAKRSSLLSGGGIATLDAAIGAAFDHCGLFGGETLSWIDPAHESRKACLFTPKGVTRDHQLPMVVFLQGSLFPALPQLSFTGWYHLMESANLSGDADRPGFILLVPLGRNTHHFYPAPDTYGLGWDNWYRNLDRSSPDLNVDVATIDDFIGQVEERGIVDRDRVYMTGWSNGAAMAQLYALNTPSIAAAAVYSAPDPYRDIKDPCVQTPFVTTMTPVMDIHNACDIVGICQTGTQFHKDLAVLYPELPQNSLIVDWHKRSTQACDASCSAQSALGDPLGVINHMIWPRRQNEALFTWLREHPLSAKPPLHAKPPPPDAAPVSAPTSPTAPSE